MTGRLQVAGYLLPKREKVKVGTGAAPKARPGTSAWRLGPLGNPGRSGSSRGG